MNSFADANPKFPYQSSEARRQLGLPDSPEVHLAITSLAEQLLSMAEVANLEASMARIAVLRIASGAVQFGWTLLGAQQQFRIHLNLPLQDGVAIPSHRISNEKDWLSEAVSQLQREGVTIDQRFQQQRTNRGWRHLDVE
jgi:hypothetical protein